MDKDSNENPVADGTTARDNQVSLLGSGSGQLSITNVEYNGTLEVTNGQPVQGTPTPSEFSGGWLIDLICGRQGNAGIAQDFVNNCGGSPNNMFGLFTLSSEPGNLNFFFGINITFSGQSSPVTLFLGQGHNILTAQNNWWIGGTSVNSSGGVALLTLPDNSQLTIGGVEDDHTFQFNESF